MSEHIYWAFVSRNPEFRAFVSKQCGASIAGTDRLFACTISGSISIAPLYALRRRIVVERHGGGRSAAGLKVRREDDLRGELVDPLFASLFGEACLGH